MREPARFAGLAGEFDLLVQALNESASPDQRVDLLLRMKAVIDEIDELILQEAPFYRCAPRVVTFP